MELKNETTESQSFVPTNLEESKQVASNVANDELVMQSLRTETASPPSATLLAWCSPLENNISIIDFNTKQNYTNFKGVQLSPAGGNPLLKEIPNTKLLVSANHTGCRAANLEIYDLSQRMARKIYSFEEVQGLTGQGDVTYNSRRGILGAIPMGEIAAYYLWNIGYSGQKNSNGVRFLKKSQWLHQVNWTVSLDFDPLGETVATVDTYGICLITEMNSENYKFNLKIEGQGDHYARCRWSTAPGEPFLYLKSDLNKLNVLDVEKKALTLSNPIQLEPWLVSVYWIDVCPNNGNLLASCGQGGKINIFDKRESGIVKTFDGIHSSIIHCVRWSPSGDTLASSSTASATKVVDLKTGKVLYSSEGSPFAIATSVCFI